MNWGVYGFPRKDIARPLNINKIYNGMPFKDECIMYYDAIYSFQDSTMTTRCTIGTLIDTVQDQSNVGNHMRANTNPKPTFIVDNGHPAIQTNGKYLTSDYSAAASTQIAVYRSPTSIFDDYGAVLGRSFGSRPYLFRSNEDRYHSSPRWSRRNGVAGYTIAPIDVINLLVIGVAYPSTDSTWHIGKHESYNASLIVYEAAQFPYELSSDQIISIESYFMGKYGLS